MTKFFVACVLSLIASAASAAELKNPVTPLPQPAGATVYWAQHQLRMLDTYRLKTDPRRADYLEFGGDAGSGGAGSGGGDAGSSGSSGPGGGGNGGGGCR